MQQYHFILDVGVKLRIPWVDTGLPYFRLEVLQLGKWKAASLGLFASYHYKSRCFFIHNKTLKAQELHFIVDSNPLP
jgi:hypothetical protein